jgi:hypothetical protein
MTETVVYNSHFLNPYLFIVSSSAHSLKRTAKISVIIEAIPNVKKLPITIDVTAKIALNIPNRA